MLEQGDLKVSTLGDCSIDSPLVFNPPSSAQKKGYFVSDSSRIRFRVEVDSESPEDGLSFEEAGPRERIFFSPAACTAAVVTCGGLSPGLNNVIRSMFYELVENYRVKKVLGIRDGYLGLDPHLGHEPIVLTRAYVNRIHELGGTVLGTSRGPQDPAIMVDFLVASKVNMLFCIGGDGTQRGAHALYEEIQRRGAAIAVVGIPKTIDNDIRFVRQTFGYATALEKAAEVIKSAHVEAAGAVNGIGLVKLMGRDAGFIAAGASIVSQDVNYTLVPEVAFPLDGNDGFLASLERRLHDREHAVVVAAEGAGQHLLKQDEVRRDDSGNVLHADIGLFLRDRIRSYFAERQFPATVKYLDPSYHIRSVPANAHDRILCDQMARHAVHAAMAGKTDMLVGQMHSQFINVPIPVTVAEKKKMEVTGDLWRAVLQSTGQPRW